MNFFVLLTRAFLSNSISTLFYLPLSFQRILTCSCVRFCSFVNMPLSPHTYHPFPGSTHLLLILVGPLSTKHSAFTSPYCLRFLQRPSGLPVGHLWAKVSSFIFVELWISHPLLLSKGSISDTPPPPLILKLHLAKLLMLALSSLCSPGRP